MKQLDLINPYNAPVYHEETVDSTMALSRILAKRGEPHGTVIAADFQEAGRGRIRGRFWLMERGSDLPFTVLLRYPCAEAIPTALTLRTGLAAALAIEEFAPALSGKVLIKWPNDIFIQEMGAAKKVAGILTEADGGNVHIGIGVNVGQRQFPGFLQDKAISIGVAAEKRFVLLEKILAQLHAELEPAGRADAGNSDWRSRIEARLYKKGEQVHFAEGAADSGKTICGFLSGIGTGGELIIAQSGGKERALIVGELL